MKRISATELAKLGKCEKQHVLNQVYKNTKEIEEVEEKRLAGIEKHKIFEEQNRRIMQKQYKKVEQYDTSLPSDKRCYIATAVFGMNAPETIFLRKWRDEYLKRHWYGRLFIKLYYKFSPFFIRKSPIFIKPFVISTLYFIIKIIKKGK